MLLLPPTQPDTSAVALDESQARVANAVAAGESVVVFGAPGTGKSTLAVECAVRALQDAGREPSSVLVLAATRRGASELRDLVAARAGRTVSAPPVRTADAAAFAVLRDLALAQGEPRPRLVSGAEQDRVLAEIVELKKETWASRLPPGLSPDILLMRGFRNELRDLVMRAAENGINPIEIQRLAVAFQKPLWGLAGQVYADYRAVMALRTTGIDMGHQFDPAELVAAGARALRLWPATLDKPTYQLVIFDDYQEATAATAQFAAQLTADGAQLVLLGNPDQAVQTFRGALPTLLAAATAHKDSTTGAFGLRSITLDVAWRQASELRQVSALIERKIPNLGAPAARRKAVAVGFGFTCDPEETAITAPPPVTAAVFSSVLQESAWIARVFREEHLLSGTPYRQMAVIARSGSDLSRLRRELILASVPVSILGSDVPLQDEPAVAPLLTMLRIVSSSTSADEQQVDGQMHLTSDLITGLLRSNFGGLDAIAMRRLRRALRAHELSLGGGRNSDHLLVELGESAISSIAESDSEMDSAVSELGLEPGIRQGVVRVFRALSAGRLAARQSEQDLTTVLWAIWAASDLADEWRELALGGGNAGARADRDLDAVMALFRRAEFFVERNPGATVARFVDDLTSQDIAADSIAAQASAHDAVAAVTPVGAAGREWEVVVVAGVQDGSWPDLRIRDTLFSTGDLVAQATGAISLAQSDAHQGAKLDTGETAVAARAQILADETRAFLVATSRAKRRLLITAVDNADLTPSPFLALPGTEPQRIATSEDFPLDLRGLVAAARTAVLGGGEQAKLAAELLAEMWAYGVPGASPDHWYGIQPLSTAAPLFADDQTIRISPSKVEAVTKCPLKWAFEAAGATAGEALNQSVGTLIHNIAGDFPSASLAQLRAELERRWPELGMAPGWLETRERSKADGMLQRLAAYYQEQSRATEVHTELDFRLEVGRTMVSGRADRIEANADGSYRIVDFKTGTTMPRQDDMVANAQLATYQLALNSNAFGGIPVGGNCGSAALVFLSQGAKGPIQRTQPGLDSAGEQNTREVLIETGEIMAAAEFAAKSNQLCRSCALKFACPLQATGKQVIT